MVKWMALFVVSVSTAAIATTSTDAFTSDTVRGVRGTIFRPAPTQARVEGCKIAEPGAYEVKVGDLIELDYSYPIHPNAMPEKVSHRIARRGAVAKSRLGIRQVRTPKRLGSGTIATYLDAKKPGEATVTLTIDDAEYVYKFSVVK